MTPEEEWRPVVGREGEYEVSDLGRVRSLDRVIDAGLGRTRIAAGRFLRPSMGRYARVQLGTARHARVHRLVAEAFLGPCPPEMEVCHNNGDGTDNRVGNLRYDTHSNNQKDRARHGTGFGGRTHCGAGHKYTQESMRVRDRDGLPMRVCRVCERERGRRYRSRRRAA